MRRAVVLVLAGCGRLGFSPTSVTDAPTDDLVGLADSSLDMTANAVTATFGERTSAMFRNVTVDTFISNEAGEPLLNYGGTDELRSELDVSERILLRFDVSALPGTVQIVSVDLTVNVTQFFANATLTARPLLQLWTEGTLDGAAGAANFQFRTATETWDTAGAGNPGSSGPTVGMVTPTQLGDVTMAIDPATVQGWVASSAMNHGLIFFNSQTESVRFASSEHASQAVRPLLSVKYVP